MKRKIFLFLSPILFTCNGFCQESETKEKGQAWPIMIVFSAHSYSWPIVKSIVTPIQPGFKIGTEYIYLARGHHKLLQTINLGYFRNTEFLNAYYLTTYFTYRYTTPFHIFIDGAAGGGYFHQRHAREVFELSSNGEFESKTDWGSPGFQAGVNLSLGYDFNINKKQYSAFISYDWYVNSPHVKGDIPFIPHSLYNIGIRFTPFK